MDRDFASFVRSGVHQYIEKEAAAAIAALKTARRGAGHTTKPSRQAHAGAARTALNCLWWCHEQQVPPGPRLIELFDLVLPPARKRSFPRDRDKSYLAAQYFAVHQEAWDGGHDRACARACGASNHAVRHWRTRDRAFRSLVKEIRGAMAHQPAYAAEVEKRIRQSGGAASLTQPKQKQ